MKMIEKFSKLIVKRDMMSYTKLKKINITIPTKPHNFIITK
jgi:hypothetical protein